MNKQLAFPVRPPRLASVAYGRMLPDRIRIIRAHETRPGASWLVMRGLSVLKRHSSHARASWWAHRIAAGDPVVR